MLTYADVCSLCGSMRLFSSSASDGTVRSWALVEDADEEPAELERPEAVPLPEEKRKKWCEMRSSAGRLKGLTLPVDEALSY